jgi:hypothetical protein
MPLKHDHGSGEIFDDGIRYILIRPDVLMGVADSSGGIALNVFLKALENSAFRNVQDSFAQYRSDGRFSDTDVLDSTCRIAATLGWGLWTANRQEDGSTIVEVPNSPFAAGFGPSAEVVCAPIVGILKAVALAQSAAAQEVREVCCVARGDTTCRFRIPRKSESVD